MRPCKRCPTCASWMLCVWGEWRHFDVVTQRWYDASLGCPLTDSVAAAATAGDYHVTPNADAIEHSTSDECPCGPTADPVERDDGSIGWVYIHHSLDGREKDE